MGCVFVIYQCMYQGNWPAIIVWVWSAPVVIQYVPASRIEVVILGLGADVARNVDLASPVNWHVP
jgi:hypothetical protein